MRKSVPIEPVVRVLDKSPKLMSSSLVFGSATPSPHQSPRLDVAFVVPRPYEFGDLDQYRKLLRAGAMGTPRHGLFNLFLVFDDCVWSSNEDCLGFRRSSNSKSIRKQILSSSQPWDAWRGRFDGPLDHRQEACPAP